MVVAVYLASVCLLVVAFVAALLALLAARERRAAREPAPAVAARVLCPIVDRVTRVRLGRRVAEGRLGVLWCERFGDAPLRCDRSCFGAAITGSLAGG